ncbi:MAG: hypothetical protein HY751_08110 [Nitrospinae bacterium]|nr:hypothetical protein [Nitrospinota bacterium]
MPLFASGAGSYGTVGMGYSRTKMMQTPPGNSKMMPATNPSSLQSVAAQHTQNFVANGRKVAQGAQGSSKISIKA